MLKISRFVKNISFVIVIAIAAYFLSYFALAAWSEPGSIPPAGNVLPPINISSTGQTKNGSLAVTTLYDANNPANTYYVDPFGNALGISAVLGGKVSIGTGSIGQEMLDIHPISNGSASMGDGAVMASGLYGVGLGEGGDAFGRSSLKVGGPINVNGDYSIGINLNNIAAGTITTPNVMSIMGGKVGIGTTNPDSFLTLYGDAELKLKSDADPLNYADIHFDNTLAGGREYVVGNYGSTSPLANDFFIRDNAAGDRFIIDSSGNVGIGTTTPDENLTVNGNVKGLAFIPGSDIRLKENIQPVENALDKIMKLNGVTFAWKESGEKGMGVIAQDVEKVFPDIVETGKVSGMKGVNYDSLIAPLIESVKQLKAENDTLKQKNESLEARIERLENLIK